MDGGGEGGEEAEQYALCEGLQHDRQGGHLHAQLGPSEGEGVSDGQVGFIGIRGIDDLLVGDGACCTHLMESAVHT